MNFEVRLFVVVGCAAQKLALSAPSLLLGHTVRGGVGQRFWKPRDSGPDVERGSTGDGGKGSLSSQNEALGDDR